MSSGLKNHLPSLGILLFFVLYAYAASIYPGGSQVDTNAVGFDWIHNYWCDLMTPRVYSGAQNPSYLISVLAMAILCSSLFLFFEQFANTLLPSPLWKRVLKYSGGISMVLALLIATPYHNSMIIMASIFGLLAVIIIIKTLFQTKFTGHKVIATFCIFLLILNNLCYYAGIFIYYLPLLQKVSFAIILIWIVLLNQQLVRLKNARG